MAFVMPFEDVMEDMLEALVLALDCKVVTGNISKLSKFDVGIGIQYSKSIHWACYYYTVPSFPNIKSCVAVEAGITVPFGSRANTLLTVDTPVKMGALIM